MNPIPPALPIPAAVPAALPIVAIVYDINVPSPANGGISSLLPGHFHAGHSDSWYYRQLTSRLIALGYAHGEYSFYAQQTTVANALNDATNLQTHPSLTWMAVPGVMRRLHVVQLCHAGSLY